MTGRANTKGLVTVPVDEESSFGYRLRPGDLVDVVEIQRDPAGVHASIVLEGIRVYAVGEEGPQTSLSRPRTASLLVTPGEVLVASLLLAERPVRLLLRSREDFKRAETNTVHRLKAPPAIDFPADDGE